MKRSVLILAVIGLFLPVFSFSTLIYPSFVQAQTTELTPQQRVELQQELAQVEAEQKQAAKELANAQGKSASLTRDIAVLSAKIRSAELDIKAKNILIQSLGNDISVKITKINKLEDRIDRGKDTLAQLLRKTNEMGNVSIEELVLSQTSISGLFKDFDSFQAVQDGLKTTFEQLRSDKASTTAEKDALDARRNKETDARYAIQQQQINIQSNQAEQKE
jgi:septal ring factor EnvC (AmiA/AmiB activator)